MADTLKPIYWCRSSKRDLDAFPDGAKQDVGFQLHLVQTGEMPLDWKALPTVGSGVFEIRVDEEGGTYRVLYVAKFEEAVYVLHCFQKKSTRGIKTPQKEIDTAARRYREVVQMRPAQIPNDRSGRGS